MRRLAVIPWITPDAHPQAWTDVAALPVSTRLVADDAHVALHCDERPGFWFGNCVILRAAPDPRDGPRLVAAWRAAFDARPAVERMVFQWESTGPPGPGTPDVPDLGTPATVERSVVLRLDAVGAAPESAPPRPCRPVATDAEFDAVADAMVSALATGPAYAEFIRWKVRALRDVVRASGDTWWAAWDGDVVAAALGLVGAPRVTGATHVVGLQEVVTRPTHRRQGGCAHLAHAALGAQFARSPAGRVIAVADPDGDAHRVYRRLGFEPVGSSWAVVAERPS